VCQLLLHLLQLLHQLLLHTLDLLPQPQLLPVSRQQRACLQLLGVRL
jgi:hypothetical protein